jgi:hypothetical protein
MDNFRVFLRKTQITNFRFHKETLNILRKSAWASVFRLKQQHINRYIYICIHAAVSICIPLCICKTELMETATRGLFVAKGKKRKTETANFHLFSANGKWNLFTLIGKQLTVIDVCCYSKRAHLWLWPSYE